MAQSPQFGTMFFTPLIKRFPKDYFIAQCIMNLLRINALNVALESVSGFENIKEK